MKVREIKFRGKRIDNGEWVYGSYVYSSMNNAHYIYDAGLCDYEVDYNTVGQCTGLEDKNGKVIYEGDIFGKECVVKFGELICGNRYHSVCFYDEIWLGNKGSKTRYQDHLNPRRAYNMIVTGNIHDNPINSEE